MFEASRTKFMDFCRKQLNNRCDTQGCSHNSTVMVWRCLTRTYKFNLELTEFARCVELTEFSTFRWWHEFAKFAICEICYIFKVYKIFMLHVFDLVVKRNQNSYP